ncbi:MAG: pyridoxal phosphate-dependent aminotransferase [Blastocatellia bacterium]|nr:pyridoxal phosphate-dependent aminotransferase [Blastocatellia bacterium]
MSAIDRLKSSDYMEWAKTRSGARFCLATSGLANRSIADLPVRLEDLELSGPGGYGYEPLLSRIAAKFDVESESVVAAMGTSMANHLAMATLLEPGDEVLIEHPTYELLVSLASYLGAKINRFARRFEDGFRIIPEEVERALTPRTRLIVITNLHNPSSAFTDNETLARLWEMAKSRGARVLVDEVYLEAMFDRAPRSAFHLGEEFLVTSSLTKAYGLSGLRCGWALASPELARKMWRLNDLFGVIPPHAAELLSVLAFDNLKSIAEHARARLETNRAALDQFLDSREDLKAVRTEYGTTSFPRLMGGRVDELCRLLREKYETTVVPGKFFEMEEHFRIGLGGTPETVEAGLERLGAALDEMAD